MAVDHAGDLWSLQARPITTLSGDLNEMDTPVTGPSHVYTRCNICDMMSCRKRARFVSRPDSLRAAPTGGKRPSRGWHWLPISSSAATVTSGRC